MIMWFVFHHFNGGRLWSTDSPHMAQVMLQAFRWTLIQTDANGTQHWQLLAKTGKQ